MPAGAGQGFGIRDTVPGCAHGRGWDGISPGVCGQRSAREGSPSPSPKTNWRENKAEGVERDVGFSPLAGLTVPNTLLRANPCGRGLPHHSRPSVLYKAKSEVPKILFLLPWFAAGGKRLLYSRGGWSSTHHLPPTLLEVTPLSPSCCHPSWQQSPQLHPLQLPSANPLGN